MDAAVYDNTVVGDVIANNPELGVAAEFDTGEQYGMAVKKDGNVDLLRIDQRRARRPPGRRRLRQDLREVVRQRPVRVTPSA